MHSHELTSHYQPIPAVLAESLVGQSYLLPEFEPPDPEPERLSRALVTTHGPELPEVQVPVSHLGKIQDREFSRLILGGNILSGWAHSRDLMYVSQLVKAYHNKDRIFATLLMAKKCASTRWMAWRAGFSSSIRRLAEAWRDIRYTHDELSESPVSVIQIIRLLQRRPSPS